MREKIKNLPVLGKIFIFLYIKTSQMFHFITHKLLRKQISNFRWKKIEKELIKSFSGSEDSEIKELIQNIKKQKRIRMFNYPYYEQYSRKNVKVYTDEKSGYRYVLHSIDGERERLYFPLSWNENRIQASYFNLLIEQDKDSPHCYYKEGFEVPEGSIVFDCGTADGNFSISIVKRAKHVYLFEGEEEWKKPLSLTFEKWKEKVTLIPNFISDKNEGLYISLDAFCNNIKLKANEKVFVKMDIEGWEEKALEGFKNTLKQLDDISMAVCSYHTQESEDHIKDFFKKEGNYCVETSRGYMILNNFCDKPYFPYIRRGIVFVKKIK